MKTVPKEENRPLATLLTLLAIVQNSVGSGKYQQLFVEEIHNGEVVYTDVIGNGRFACAFFVSDILHTMNLIDGSVHTTVDMTVADLIASGWYEINEPIPGAVILWGPKLASDKKPHRHIGFYLGNDEAVSTGGETGRPMKHHVTYGNADGKPTRVIEAIYFHRTLCA